MSETTHTGQFRPVIDFVLYGIKQNTPTGCQQPPLEFVECGITQQLPPPRWLTADPQEKGQKNLQIPLKF